MVNSQSFSFDTLCEVVLVPNFDVCICLDYGRKQSYVISLIKGRKQSYDHLLEIWNTVQRFNFCVFSQFLHMSQSSFDVHFQRQKYVSGTSTLKTIARHGKICISSPDVVRPHFFLFLAESPGAYTRSVTQKKALVLSLRAECTRSRVQKKRH